MRSVGVIAFDDACKKIEQLSLRDEESLKRAYADTQSNVRQYFLQLKGAYATRDQLWNDLQSAVDKSGKFIFRTHGEILSSGPNELYQKKNLY